MDTKRIVSALRTMLNLETMAVQIYRSQIWRFGNNQEIAQRLIAAMENEREHVAGLRARLKELNGSPSFLRFLFFLVGALPLGFFPALLGQMTTLKNDIWVEKRAVRDYSAFLQSIDFDDKSKALIEKNIADERAHVRRWEDSIKELKGVRSP